MSPAAAYAIWIVGETLMICGGAFALYAMARDLRTAWPQIVALFTEREDDDA